MACPAQVCGGGSQCPAPAVDADFPADLFKFAVAEIVKQILSAAILGILETLGHDACGGEMPKINAFGIITANEKVQQPVAVVIEPDGRVCIRPRGQSSQDRKS